MRVQKIRLPQTEQVTWLVVDNDNKLIEPITDYLHYLSNVGRSPNTVKCYATHLKLFWEFINYYGLNWKTITLVELSDLIPWLRKPNPKIISIQPQESKRLESTINTMISTIYGFYKFHQRMKTVQGLEAYQQKYVNKSYKPFLHHVSKDKLTVMKLLKLKEPKKLPKVLTKEQVNDLVNACNRIRDKFLILLLYETGMRIGQVIGLHHQDIRSWDNEIDIIPREDNTNGARAKTTNHYIIHVSKELMNLYTQYFLNEYPEDIDSDYVFINIWNGRLGKPLNYSAVNSLFKALTKRTKIQVTPHMFRHTHATELIRDGWNMSYVQKRLGHCSVQTTIDTYAHLDNDDLKQAYKEYEEKRNEKKH